MMPDSLSWLANHLWQSSVFAGLVGLLALALRKNPASIRHKLWLIASLKFLIPLSLLFALGSQLQWRLASNTTQPQWFYVADGISQPFAAEPRSQSIQAVHSNPLHGLSSVLLVLWLCGTGTVLFVWVREWRRLRSILKAAPPVDMNLPIAVVSTPAHIGVGVIGIVRPVLALPEGITDRLTATQLQSIVAHELCHARRGDNLFAALHMIVEAVFWFYPPVWWIGRRLVDERERACDEYVLSLIGEPRLYAESILTVCRFSKESPLPCVSGVTSSNLKKRIEDIMSNRVTAQLTFARKAVLGAATITAVALPILFGSAATQIHGQTLLAESALPESSQQSTSERLAFPTASIKPSGSIKPSAVDPIIASARRKENGGMSAKGIVVAPLFAGAFDTERSRIVGFPEWVNSTYFDVETDPEKDATQEERRLMMRTLLEDNFKLQVHKETRFVPVYVLTAAPSGIKLDQPKEGSCVNPESLQSGAPPLPDQPLPAPCGTPIVAIRAGVGRLAAGNIPISELTRVLSNMLGRVIIDKTQFTKRFDAHLTFAPDDALAGLPGSPHLDAPPIANGLKTIFTAMEEQLGLKLESGTGPVEVLVVDHMEKP